MVGMKVKYGDFPEGVNPQLEQYENEFDDPNLYNLSHPFKFTKYHMMNLLYKTGFFFASYVTIGLVTYPLRALIIRYISDT